MLSRLLCVALTLAGSTALACSCARRTQVFPPSGSVVPRNVVFQVTQNVGGLGTLVLFEGTTPVLIEEPRANSNWVTVKPLMPLTAGATVLLTNQADFNASFTVGTETDDVPPAARELLNTTRTFVASSSTCGSSESVQLSIAESSAQDLTGFLVFSGPTANALSSVPETFTETGLLANTGCDQSFPLRTTPDLALAVRVVDAAGNTSALSSVLQAKTAGCSSSTGLLGLAGVLLLFRRRRG